MTPTLTSNNNAATVMTNSTVELTCHTDTNNGASVTYIFYNNDTVITTTAVDKATVTNSTQSLFNTYSCTAMVGTAVSSRSPVIRQAIVGKFSE